MFPMWDMRPRESESGGGRNPGWQQCFGVGLEKKGVAIRGMSKVEGGTGHCANLRTGQRGCGGRGAVEENGGCKALELRGDISVGALKSGREEGRWKETEDRG